MATCKDCLHIDVCYMVEHYGFDIAEDKQEYDCNKFQAKTNYVEVVLCKDCWLFDKTGYDEDNEHEEDLSLHSGWCKAWRRETQGCHFCSYGERREGE